VEGVGEGGWSKERKKRRERESLLRQMQTLVIFRKIEQGGGIVLYKCHQSCEVEHCFSCFLSRNRSCAFGCIHAHTPRHFETIALETLLCQHIGHRLTHIWWDQVHYQTHTHTDTYKHPICVCSSPTMIHCGKRLLISPCSGR